MFHGVIHKITLAQFLFETRCGVLTCYEQETDYKGQLNFG